VPLRSILRNLLLPAAAAAAIASAMAQAPNPIDELSRHLEGMKRQLEDPSVGVAQREILAIETAGTLDRAAQAETHIGAKQARWDEAVRLLDEFREKNRDQTRTKEFKLQAAVYRWAQARAWHDRHASAPADDAARAREVAALDDAIARLRSIVSDEDGVLPDNIRFRLAWALADRAELEAPGAPTRLARDEQALKLLEKSPGEPRLAGYHKLLKAELLRRSGKFADAAVLITEASKLNPPPPESEVLDVSVRVLTNARKFVEARSVVTASKLAPGAKALDLVRIALAEARAAGGGDRSTAIKELMDQVRALRVLKAPETRIALAEWAASGVVPGDESPPEAWDALAEGAVIRDDHVKAAEYEEKAAERAEKTNAQETAAGYRLRGAGFLFQAGKYVEADAILTKVMADPHVGALRPKAGLLQCLTRGRAVAAGAAGIAANSYAEALERQIRDFPNDPTATEARWLLGAAEQDRGASEKARALWGAIPPTADRWIDARLAIADGMRRDIEDRMSTAEDQAQIDAFAAASKFLTESLEAARPRPESDQAELMLREARLELIPDLGKPRQARDVLDRVNRMNLTAAQRYRVRLGRTVALAALGRYVEAEREAQQHPSWADPASRPDFMDAIRLLDLGASTAQADLQQRRFGLVARLLIQPLLKEGEETGLDPDQRSELTFRLARSLLFQGDAHGAQEVLRGWSLPRKTVDDRLLRDLADLYSRLEAYELAIDVDRLRTRNLASGIPAWFDARYNLALAYYRLGQRREALQLIEGTAILHPDLGGGSLQEKFIRLRQRLSAPQ